jgi:hypothetical protein
MAVEETVAEGEMDEAKAPIGMQWRNGTCWQQCLGCEVNKSL